MYKQEQKKEPNSWLAACLIDFTEIMIALNMHSIRLMLEKIRLSVT